MKIPYLKGLLALSAVNALPAGKSDIAKPLEKKQGSGINPANIAGAWEDIQTQSFPGRPGWELKTDRSATAQNGVITQTGLSGTEGPPEVDGPNGWKTKLGFGGGSAILLDNYDTNTTYATGYNNAQGLPADGNVACFVLDSTTACDLNVITVTSSGSSPATQGATTTSPTTQGVTTTSPTTQGVTATSPTTQGVATTSPTTLATGSPPLRPTSGSPSTSTAVVYVTASATQTSGADRGPQPPGAGAVKLAIDAGSSIVDAGAAVVEKVGSLAYEAGASALNTTQQAVQGAGSFAAKMVGKASELAANKTKSAGTVVLNNANNAKSRFEALKAAGPSHVPKTAKIVSLSK